MKRMLEQTAKTKTKINIIHVCVLKFLRFISKIVFVILVINVLGLNLSKVRISIKSPNIEK